MDARPGSRTLTGELHDRLRADILAGRLRPGNRLKLAELQERYGARMGVVREALIRLAEQGLVQAEPQVGFTVTPLSREALVELTDARVAVECLVLERSIRDGDTRWEANVLAAHHLLDRTAVHPDGDPVAVSEEWSRVHLEFHDVLLAGCANARLREIAHGLRVSAELYRTWSQTLGPPAGRDVAAEHRELAEAALARDVERATAGLARHIERTAEILLRYVT